MRMHSASSSGTSIVHGAVAPGSASAPTRRCAWARPADLADLLVDGPVPGRSQLGTLAGRLVANPPRRSVLVQAPTGGGKTPRVAVPAVLRHTGPAVVASVKADVLHLTLARRRGSGPVWVFDPTGAAGLRAARWSPLSSIAGYGDALSAAAWLADSSKVESRGLEEQRFWDTPGQSCWRLGGQPRPGGPDQGLGVRD